MRVRQVTDGMLVEPNNIYVMPAKTGLALSRQAFELSGVALYRLENLGLVQRSHDSYKGIRVYKFSEPPEPSRQSHLLKLMSLGHNRLGRQLLPKHLKHPSPELRRNRDSGLRLA
jgi:hypothetical protein